MIDPPSHQLDHPDLSVGYAVQLLIEEAQLIGWQRVDFLTAIMDAANARLSAIEDEAELEGEASQVAE